MKRIILLLWLISTSCFSQILKRDIDDKIVVFTFDDASASHYSVVAPLLKQYNFNATFFVCEFPPNYLDSTKYMNWRQIKELNNWGFEVANHTKSHAAVGKLSKDDFLSQLNYIEAKCDSLGIERPINFAYPGYNLTPTSLKVLELEGYKFARAGGGRTYNPLQDHPLLLPSWAPNADNKKEIFDAINLAKNGNITIVTFHGVPDVEHPWVNTPLSLFKEYLVYLSANQFKVIALRDLENYVDIKTAKKLITPNFDQNLRN
jgi:peptidoglycan/xylan/chitin deacetylase (PgdA/CDA1 family)